MLREALGEPRALRRGAAADAQPPPAVPERRGGLRAAVAAGPSGRPPAARARPPNPGGSASTASWRFALAENPASIPEARPPRGVVAALVRPLLLPTRLSTTRAGRTCACPAAGPSRATTSPTTRTSSCLSATSRPRFLAEHNPTGLYRVRFELPSGGRRRVVLHVGGARELPRSLVQRLSGSASRRIRGSPPSSTSRLSYRRLQPPRLHGHQLFRRELRRGPGPMVVRRHLS